MKRLALPLLLACAAALARAEDPDHAAWLTQVPLRMQQDPAFAFVQEDPALPRVLLIGDSISIGYTPAVREALRGKANVLRIPANGSSTTEGLANLDRWLGAGPWAVIHFNWGLHDLKHWKDGKLDLAGPRVNSLEQYEKNLRLLVARLQATGARLIWASTTPVPEASNGRDARSEEAYNEVAARVMSELNVPIDDLHAAVRPELERVQLPHNVHFNGDGSRFLAAQVAASIRAALPPAP